MNYFLNQDQAKLTQSNDNLGMGMTKAPITLGDLIVQFEALLNEHQEQLNNHRNTTNYNLRVAEMLGIYYAHKQDGTAVDNARSAEARQPNTLEVLESLILKLRSQMQQLVYIEQHTTSLNEALSRQLTPNQQKNGNEPIASH